MAGGGKVRICDADDFGMMAQVINGALRVTGIGGGGGGDVNIASVGGVVIGATVPVSGTVTIVDGGGSITVDGTVTVLQGTSPWVISGTVAVSSVGGTVTVTGSVDAALPGTVSAGNSSTTPLAGNATFTGVFEEVTDFAVVTITVFANVASATEGMLLQWSGNGVDVDRQEAITIAAGTAGGRALTLNVRARFFRVVYTNGGAAQATFRLVTSYHVAGTGLSNLVISEDIPLTAIAVLTRSVITGESSAGGGTFVNVKVTPAGAVNVEGTVSVTGTVAVSSVIPGTGATNLGKAEDALHASGDTGVMALAVRSDSGAALAGNGDYIPLMTDSLGRLRVLSIVPDAFFGTANLLGVPGTGDASTGAATGVAPMFDTKTPTLSSNTWSNAFINESDGGILVHPVGGDQTVSVNGLVPGTGATSLGKAEDALHTSGDVGVMALAVRNDAGTALAANGDYIAITTNSVGSVYVAATSVVPGTGVTNLGKAAGQAFVGGEVGVAMLGLDLASAQWQPMFLSSNILLTSVTAVTPGTAATNLGKAEDAAHVSGDTGVMMLCVRQDVLASLGGATNDYMPPTLDNLGRLHVINEGGKTTYRAATTVPFAAAAGAAAFFVISGSSTHKINVQRIVISGFTQTAVNYNSIVCEKWSTAAFTGGTPVALTKVPLDSNYGAAQAALVQVYTAAPTEGTLVGTIAARRYLSQATTAAAAGTLADEMVFDFRVLGENNPTVLRGTTQSLSLAFAAAPASAVTMSLEVEWTEEPN